jgi:hypothetical protein
MCGDDPIWGIDRKTPGTVWVTFSNDGVGQCQGGSGKRAVSGRWPTAVVWFLAYVRAEHPERATQEFLKPLLSEHLGPETGLVGGMTLGLRSE